jgi:2Fe-2S ferredoxin
MSNISIIVEDKIGNKHKIEGDSTSKISLLELLINNKININGKCGGIAECSSCHVYIMSNHETPEMSMIEDLILDEVELRQQNSRLSCQLGLRNYMDGMEIKIPN